MFVPNCRRCPLPLNLQSFILNVSKSCTLFKGKGHRLQFGTNIKGKTCNLLVNLFC
ncbi:hypothetical protein Hanom_Chr11g00977431 [Helianthus anomalus]